MNASDATVNVTIRDDVAYVELNAPPYNILTCELMRQCEEAVARLAEDDQLKAVAFTASGKAFSAGADVAEHAPDQARTMIETFGRLIRRMLGLEIPIVMAVDGAALGGGFEFVMLADVVLATERAKFGQPEIRLGFFAPLGVVRLPQQVGVARAAEITASGRTYSAPEMRDMGFVARVMPAGELRAVLESVLDDFRQASPLVLRMNMRVLKRQANRQLLVDLARAEQVFLDELMATEEVREGVAAFYEKRSPQWKNR
jgi:cyclohexa-1,5-dienecarbonyl-CoA hydratase